MTRIFATNFVPGAVWHIPFTQSLKGLADKILDGWELSGIGTARGGRPVNIRY